MLRFHLNMAILIQIFRSVRRTRAVACGFAIAFGATQPTESAELVLSNFNNSGFNYTFDNFTQTVGPTNVRLRDTTNGWGGGGITTPLNLSSFSNGRLVVDLIPQSGNGVSSFDIELIESLNGGQSQRSGKWTFNVSSLTPGMPVTLVSQSLLSAPNAGIGDYANLNLANISTWQVLGEFGSPAPFDLRFDRVAVSTDVAAPPRYNGAEPNAPWRAEAVTRIDALRKADLNVQVVDAIGNPVPNAAVSVAMQQHEFGFGSAVQASRLRDNAAQHTTYKSKVAELFNMATLENDLKWPPWEGEWGSNFSSTGAISALNWLNSRGIRNRGHVMVWPGSANLPADIRQMLADSNLTPSEQQTVRNRIAAHINEVAAATNDKVVAWDVINETRTNHDLMDELSEGNQAMVTWFQQANSAAPGVDLYINDYGILSSGGGTNTSNQNQYYSTIEYLKKQGAPIDGIGFQGHFDESSLTGPPQLWTILDRFNQLGLKMQVTEFDFNTTDEQLQADFTRDFMTAMFAHEGIDDFIQWGFWENAHWLPNAAMFRSDWSIKPNGEAFLDLVFDEWWTNESLAANATGTAGLRGFKGKYAISATAKGITRSKNANLTGTGTSVTVTLPFVVGDYNGDNMVDAGDYVVWRDSLGSSTNLAADGNNNGIVDAADYQLWRTYFGAVLPPARSVAIPEPLGVVLVLTLVALKTLCRPQQCLHQCREASGASIRVARNFDTPSLQST